MKKIHTLGHLQVRMAKSTAPAFVKEWLGKISVNDTLPRGKAFDPYRHITANSQSSKQCNFGNPFQATGLGKLSQNARERGIKIEFNESK
ncbi:hypothetical protein ACTN3U_003477 [Vibrio alginolyticus]